MELNQLKNAWSRYSSTDADKHRLDETELHRMLKRRTNGLIDRIDRNVRIGFAAVFALVLFFMADDFFITPNFAEGALIPTWIYAIDALNTLFFLGTFLYFGLQYRGVKKQYSQSSDMRRVLGAAIQLLNTYRRLFYWALCVLLIVISVTFVTGLLFGFQVAATRLGVEIDDLNTTQMIHILLQGLGVLLASVAMLFFLFRWGFRRLYGRYIKQLEGTLAELDEIE